MNYLEKINELLQPKSNLEFKVLDLFAGCGGLSLGFESLGFQIVGYEMDLKATETYNTNLNGKCFAQKITSETQYNEYFDVVIGGPPSNHLAWVDIKKELMMKETVNQSLVLRINICGENRHLLLAANRQTV